MKTYKANNANNTINKRVKKVHSKAKFVGTLYFLGALALAALACLGVVAIDGTKLWVVDFWKPYANLFNEQRNIFDVIVATLYLFVVLSVVINFLRAFGKLGDLLRKNHKKVGRIKQNMQAMDDMGKLFSGSFAAILIFHFLIYIIQPLAVDATRPNVELLMPMGYATLGVGLVIHFLAGLIHGTVSNFQVGGQVANVVEEKRECGLFVYFFRNLVQVAAVAGILFFFTQCCNFNATISALLSGQNPIAGADVMKELIPLALQVLTVIWILVLIKHATAPTEFNLYGMQGSGMKNFRVFSFFVVLTAGGAFALDYLNYQPDFPVDNLIVAGIALVAFLADCIFKTRVKKEKKEDDDELTDEEAFNAFAPVPAQVPVKANGQVPVQMPVQAGYPQPIYVPVYYPYPTPTANLGVPQTSAQAPCCAPTPVAKETNKKPAPAPAPSYIKPTPAPTAQPAEGKNDARKKRQELKERNKDLKRAKADAKTSAKIAKKNQKVERKVSKQEESFAKKNAAVATLATASVAMAAQQPVQTPVAPVTPVVTPVVEEKVEPKVDFEAVNEIETPLDPHKQWDVRCPQCGKQLRVREVSPYHRCPSCDKVFKLRKFETYAKKD